MKLPVKNKKGILIIISAPSGAGKTTVCKYLLKKLPEIVFSVSYTTRSKRPGEVEGKDYFFVNKEKFLNMVKQKKFIEWAQVYNNYYGTPKENIEKNLTKGKDILLDIDVQGGKNVRKHYPDGVYIFLLPPSWKALKERLYKRAKDPKEIINLRLKMAQRELKYIKYYDYIVVNKELKTTFNIIESIIKAEKNKRIRYEI